jgi:hypothetical protein
MPKVIKSDQVRLGSPRAIALEAPPVLAARQEPEAAAPGRPPEQVRIVEQTDQYVVIEVSCPCGEKLLVQCDYPAGAAEP